MNISQSILQIYPALEFWIDFIVIDNSDWKWPQLEWYNTEITQPTQAELETAFMELEIIQNKETKIKEFKQIEAEAREKRLSYITLEMLDDWDDYKSKKQTKLDAEWLDIKARHAAKKNELMSEFWDNILDDL